MLKMGKEICPGVERDSILCIECNRTSIGEPIDNNTQQRQVLGHWGRMYEAFSRGLFSQLYI